MALFQKYQREDQLVHIVRDMPTNSQNDDGFIYLLVGFGNVGKSYADNRHNAGFKVLDAYREKLGFPDWQDKPKFKALISEDYSGGKKVILVKPTTMYNLLGESVRALKDFYKLTNKDVVVVHDELDLPFGTVKEKNGGGSGGNNGMKSLISHIGTDFKRIRIGIKNDLLEKADPADFVLANFTANEKKLLPEVITAAIQKLV